MKTLALFNNKESVSSIVASAKSSFLSGGYDPIQAFINISKYAKAIEEFKKDKQVKNYFINALSDYPKDQRTFGDCKVDVTRSARYDYSSCGDEILNGLYEEREALDKQIKERENMLKTVSGNTILGKEETGEIQVVKPPVKTSTEVIKLTFKK